METVLYILEVSQLSDEWLFKKAYSLVSDARRKKADRLITPSDKCLSLGVEILLMYGLKKAGITDPVSICCTDKGKPYLADKKAFFSLSHSGKYAICTVSDKDVGCDIEKIGNADTKIAKRFFHPSEYEDILNRSLAAEKNMLFYRYWTLKESFIKAVGLGMKLPMNSFCIIPTDKNISVKQSVDTNAYSFAEFSEIPGYCCGVCMNGQEKKIRCITLTISEIMEELKSEKLNIEEKEDPNT